METIESTLEQIWLGPLSSIRDGLFSVSDDEKIRNALNAVPEYDELVPVNVVKNLWFMPMFLEWQTERVAKRSPENLKLYYELTSWVIERVGELFGNP